MLDKDRVAEQYEVVPNGDIIFNAPDGKKVVVAKKDEGDGA